MISYQQRLCHENVVRQLDSFAVDGDCFVTVLEYCPGIDLERYLKQNVYLKETEARAIVIQVRSIPSPLLSYLFMNSFSQHSSTCPH